MSRRQISAPPVVEPRNGPALRCRQLAIGYPERTIAGDINLEIDHGARAAIVGDNGQGKTTFLRTVVDSLSPMSGEVRWGYGCQIGIYAQHVYTSLPETKTVLEYLEYCATARHQKPAYSRLGGRVAVSRRAGRKADFGSVRRRACPALSGRSAVGQLQRAGSRRAGQPSRCRHRRCPGRALVDYHGTVIFTSHDRHFLKRVATSIVEVRDGRVVNYRGDYDAYLYSINQEIDAHEADAHKTIATGQQSARRASPQLEKKSKTSNRDTPQTERAARKEIASLEKTIARLGEQKAKTNQLLLSATDPAEALRLHEELVSLTAELEAAEERWLRLQN